MLRLLSPEDGTLQKMCVCVCWKCVCVCVCVCLEACVCVVVYALCVALKRHIHTHTHIHILHTHSHITHTSHTHTYIHIHIKSTLLTCAMDGTLRLWDVNDTSKNLNVIKAKKRTQGARISVSACAFSSDGNLIIGGVCVCVCVCMYGTIAYII